MLDIDENIGDKILIGNSILRLYFLEFNYSPNNTINSTIGILKLSSIENNDFFKIIFYEHYRNYFIMLSIIGLLIVLYLLKIIVTKYLLYINTDLYSDLLEKSSIRSENSSDN